MRVFWHSDFTEFNFAMDPAAEDNDALPDSLVIEERSLRVLEFESHRRGATVTQSTIAKLPTNDKSCRMPVSSHAELSQNHRETILLNKQVTGMGHGQFGLVITVLIPGVSIEMPDHVENIPYWHVTMGPSGPDLSTVTRKK